MKKDRNNFRLQREDAGDLKPEIRKGKKIKAYHPPGFEKWPPDPGKAVEASVGSNQCCCDAVCSCDTVTAGACSCHEVCTCDAVCSCNAECSCVGNVCSCQVTGSYYTYYQTYYQTYYVYYS